MENLAMELEEVRIVDNETSTAEKLLLLEECIKSVVGAYVPKIPGKSEPCVEKDFREYRTTVNENLVNVARLMTVVKNNIDTSTKQMIDNDERLRATVAKLQVHALLLIGEHSEKNLWNNAESVIISGEIANILCDSFGYENPSAMLRHENRFRRAISHLREKLLRSTWKCYPAAVVCYKWLLNEVQQPILVLDNIRDLLPTSLILLANDIPDNRLIALQCINCILRYSYTLKAKLMENGYAHVIYDALDRLSHERNILYIAPLYSAFEMLLEILEFSSDDSFDPLQQWNQRDDVLERLLDHMDWETNLELRHAYVRSLPQLLNNAACAKWCERLIRQLAEYCSNHTDLRTLKASLQASKTLLTMFQERIPAHGERLYTAFLKLHLDLMEQTPVFDQEITQSLETCLHLLYKLTPGVGSAVMLDDRMRFVLGNSLGDTRYCN